MPHPAISVIVPAYNTAATIGECIDSILAQTFTDFELIIADDGSTDNTCEIISRYKDPRMRLLRREHDFIATLNTLLYEAKGKYIARIDADDVMMPDRLRLQYEYMEAHPEVAVVGGGMEFFSDKRFAFLGKTPGNEEKTKEEKIGKAHAVTAYDLLDSCGIYNPTSMIRSGVLRRYGLKYEQGYICAQDFRLWADMIKHDLIIHNIENVLTRYRTSETQISSKHAALQIKFTHEIQQDLMQWIREREEEVKNDYEVVPVSGKSTGIVLRDTIHEVLKGCLRKSSILVKERRVLGYNRRNHVSCHKRLHLFFSDLDSSLIGFLGEEIPVDEVLPGGVTDLLLLLLVLGGSSGYHLIDSGEIFYVLLKIDIGNGLTVDLTDIVL